MCLYPRLIKNRKYTETKKNKGIIPECKDKRTLMVPIGCGKCMECKKQKARGWSIRLQEEIRHDTTGQFVTLTFSNESIAKLKNDLDKEIKFEGYELDNALATLAVRRFLERWRKKYKTSVKHWLITELGHNGTENVHIHGIIFTKEKESIKSIWQYGYVYIGDYVNEKTINYTVKYATKADPQHKEYDAKILCSSGIGKNYTTRTDAKLNAYKTKGETDERYYTRKGTKIALPTYFRNKIYTEEEREKLWIQKIDKMTRYVNGQKIDISTEKGIQHYYKALAEAQRDNQRLGYGNGKKDWQQYAYEQERRKLMYEKRLMQLIN